MFMRWVLMCLAIVMACRVPAQVPATQAWYTQQAYAEKQVVVLNNAKGAVPVRSLLSLSVAVLHNGCRHAAVFDSIVRKYVPAVAFDVTAVNSEAAFDSLHDQLKYYNLLVVELSEDSRLDAAFLSFLQREAGDSRVFYILGGSGKKLSLLDGISAPVIWYNQDNAAGASCAAQVLFGGVAAVNRLDARYSARYTKGSGYTTIATRLGYAVPETVHMNSRRLLAVDTIMAEAIAAKAAPGGVIAVVKNGRVVFSKAYGKHTYDGIEPVVTDDIFDLASVTKIAATTLAAMRLYDAHQLSIDSPLSAYIARTRAIADKKDIRVKEVLLHQAGFVPFIPFYEQMKPGDCSKDSSAAYSTKVADGYFVRANYFNEVMWPAMLQAPAATRGKYVYSDLSMYYMKEVIEETAHRPLQAYMPDTFYKQLGLQATGYLPRTRFDKNRIIPTVEKDGWFRDMPLQGYVHDPGAAMAGGVSGHAGLFANANDLAILFQMVLNKGVYGGERYLKAATVELFTARQSAVSRRGLGFDRYDPDTAQHYPSSLASPQTYGHTGYTGTAVWVDPASELIFIFLSNRVYPVDVGRGAPLMKLNIRGRIMDEFYRAMEK